MATEPSDQASATAIASARSTPDGGRLAAGAGTWRAFIPGLDVPVATSIDLVHRLFESPHVRTLDLSNNYGLGESERRAGLAIREYGGVPDGFLVQTKADRDSETGEFSGRRMRQSLEESLERLGLDRFPMLYLHDPENVAWDEAMADDGPVAALVEARDAGLIGVLGVAGGPVGLMRRYLETGLFSALVTHNRYTLVDRSADELLTFAASLGVHVSNASPYGGGLLTVWPPRTDRYAYGEAPASIVAAAGEAARLRAEHDVPLAAAALHFSVDDPRIDRTIVGMRTPEDHDATVELLAVEVPASLTSALRALPLDPSGWQEAVATYAHPR